MTDQTSYYRLSAYFLPLALQVMLQSLTYPLVAVVAARGAGGALNTAGLAQSSAIIGLLWALGNGLLTGGMVYARTHKGYRCFAEVTRQISMGIGVIYLILIVPPVSRLIFNTLLGLPDSIAVPAKSALVYSLPMTIMFFLRTPYMVLMYVRGATHLAFLTAVVRVVITLAFAALCCLLNMVGVFWAVVCMTTAIAMETLFLRYFARRNEPLLPPGDVKPARSEILSFSLTLSVGAAMLSLSGFLIGAFIARAPFPERMLPVYYLVFAAVSIISSGAIRIQTLTLALFGKSADANRRIFIFSVVAGLVMGLLHLPLIIPGLRYWYYSGMQGLPTADLPLVVGTSLTMILFSPAVSMRSFMEGVAAYYKKPALVLTGQAVYLAMVASSAFFALNLHVPGNQIGPIALIIANSLGAGAMLLALRWEQKPDIPVPPTSLSQNIR